MKTGGDIYDEMARKLKAECAILAEQYREIDELRRKREEEQEEPLPPWPIIVLMGFVQRETTFCLTGIAALALGTFTRVAAFVWAAFFLMACFAIPALIHTLICFYFDIVGWGEDEDDD